YIPGLKRRLISVGQLDEDGYHVGIRDQQWKVTKGSLVVARENKYGSMYMVEVDIYFCKPVGLGKQKNLSFIMSVNIRELQRLEQVHTEGYGLTFIALILGSRYYNTVIKDCSRSCGRIVMLKMVSKSPLQFCVAERLSRTFRVESTGIHVEAPKILWADSISTTYLIYRIPYVLIGLHIVEEEWRGKDTSLTHLKVAAQMKFDIAFRIRRVTRLSEAKISHLWTRFMEPCLRQIQVA
ncbi:hypothetical protein Tco_0043058, partial [Tanacetum coccineum]